MDDRPIPKRPTWWLLYSLGVALTILVAVIETSAARGPARLFLELASAITVSLLMLVWLRANRIRIVLAEMSATRALELRPDVAVDAVADAAPGTRSAEPQVARRAVRVA